MVTAELSVAILAALAVLTMMAWGAEVVMLQVRCADVAAAVARQEARGDRAGIAQARAGAPAGARVSVQRSPGLVSVSVRMTARPGPDWLPAVPLRARAEVVPEPEGTR